MPKGVYVSNDSRMTHFKKYVGRKEGNYWVDMHLFDNMIKNKCEKNELPKL